MPRGKRITPETKSRILDEARRGTSNKEIARMTGVSISAVTRMTYDVRINKPNTFVKAMDPDLKAQWDYLHKRYGRQEVMR